MTTLSNVLQLSNADKLAIERGKAIRKLSASIQTPNQWSSATFDYEAAFPRLFLVRKGGEWSLLT